MNRGETGGRTRAALVARWLRFNAVGVAGAGVQLALLALLTRALGVDPRLAVLLAVEVTLLCNFRLHEKWTWRDRPTPSLRGRLERLARFHLCNGLISLLGNLAVIHVLMVQLGLPVIPSGLAAIGACSLLNFVLGHRVVFREDVPVPR